MAVTEWEVVQPGVVDGHPHSVPGNVVNGSGPDTPGGGGGWTPPTTGRLFPAPRVIEVTSP